MTQASASIISSDFHIGPLMSECQSRVTTSKVESALSHPSYGQTIGFIASLYSSLLLLKI
jgi:hypothetical protein